jgi:hypothetical protein
MLLLDNFITGDIAKVRELKNYLTKLSDDDYIGLYPIDQWIIEYWTNDYASIIQNVKKFDSINFSLRKKIRPLPDDLLLKLEEKSYSQKETIVNSINNSPLHQQDKDFLIMHLYSILLTPYKKDITQDTLNYLADGFIQKYPSNELEDFIKSYIRYKLEPSNWGLTFEFFSGYGIFSGDSKNHFSNNVPIGVAFDVCYKKLVLYLRDYIGFSLTNHDFTDKGEVWTKNSQVRVFLPEASLGYAVHDGKNLKLVPFIGISSSHITPTDYDLKVKPKLKDYALPFTTTYSTGFNIDLKFGDPKVAMVTNGPEQSYWFIKIRYAYNFPRFSKSLDGFNGDMQYVTIGFGGFGRRIKRVY